MCRKIFGNRLHVINKYFMPKQFRIGILHVQGSGGNPCS